MTTEPFEDVDADDLGRENLKTWFVFLSDRYEESGTPMANRMAGYSYGYASAMIDAGRRDLAAPKINWLMAESEAFKDHPGYPSRPDIALKNGSSPAH
ncbi:hypothetical protein AB0A05_27090 [Streptomyces sp. NPDC046374]|uniref:hypothetical protein n=1 Tax=Streptomyces sp. NPDC046374 TaxID=3154917 RepID=UPI0033D78B47